MHVDTDLSAYLDGELDPSDHARVEAHLDGCDRCRGRLAELRATASLIASLPTVRPARSVVPHVVERFNWLRPIRSLSAVASGAFLFVFLVTAVARGGSGLGGGAATTAAGPAGQPAAPFAATAAPEAAAAPRAFSPPPAQVAAPAAVGAAAPTPLADTARAAGASPSREVIIQPTGAPAFQQTAVPKAAEAATPAATAAASALPRAESQASPKEVVRTTSGLDQRPSPLADPLVWFGLAVIAALAAIGAHWRLRTT